MATVEWDPDAGPQRRAPAGLLLLPRSAKDTVELGGWDEGEHVCVVWGAGEAGSEDDGGTACGAGWVWVR